MRRSAALVVMAAVLAAPVASAQMSGGVDVIKLKGGKEVKGKIVEVSSEKVSYRPPSGGAGQLSENMSNVADIIFFDAPFGVSKGDTLLKQGKSEQAIAQYRKALDQVKKKQVRELHKQYALYGIARSHQADGAWDDALTAYKRLLKECPKTCFKLEAYDGAITSAQRKGSKGAIDEMIALMKKEKDPRIASKAELTIALSDLNQKKYKAAQDRFDKLSRTADQSVQASAQIGLIRCYDAQKKTADLKRLCSMVVKGANNTPALQAAAYTALADIEFEEATSKKDAKLLKQALLSYLRTVVRYYPSPGDPSDDYEKSLYQAGLCFTQLRTSLKKPESKTEYAARATALFEELIRDFKGSSWATKAKSKIKDLKK